MAPSSRSRTAAAPARSASTKPQQQVQVQLRSVLSKGKSTGTGKSNGVAFGRVTKSRSERTGLRVKFAEVSSKGQFENWDAGVKSDVVDVDVPVNVKKEATVGATRPGERKAGSKRKREECGDSSGEDEHNNERESASGCLNVVEQRQKRRLYDRAQLPSPPASRDGTDCEENGPPRIETTPSSGGCYQGASLQPPAGLPTSLLDLISMHAAFLKAFSLHFAHNGASSPAELFGLMDSVTRLWKKRNVCKVDIQRMLGIYEIAADEAFSGSKQIQQRNSPFKIMTSGLGANVRTNIEYVGSTPHNENSLQTTYSDTVRTCFSIHSQIEDLTTIPLLTIVMGTQTSLHRAKAASTRAEIMSLSASAQSRSTPDFSKLSIVDPLDHTPAAVKSRTLSLFDRVRAKGLASMNSAAPTSEQVARQHALGRIGEVVEFLRMKQQQKMSAQFHSTVHDSPGKVRNSGKISFSLGAIVRDIRQSVPVPIAEEMIRLCLRILSQEIPGDWCRMIELGSVVSITLQGAGLSGVEVKNILDRKSIEA